MTINLLDIEALLPSFERELRADGKSTQTARIYNAGVRSFLRWCHATGTEPELTKVKVQNYIVGSLDGGAESGTVLTHLKGVKRFSAWLAKEGEIKTDELVGIGSPKPDTKVVPTLSNNEIAALIKACTGKRFIDRRDECIVRLMLETGARAGEVVAMEVKDVDLDRCQVTIRRGKGGKGRTVPINSPQTLVALDRYLRARRVQGLQATGALWTGGKVKTFGYHGLSQMLKRRARMAGMNDIHAHRLRHTFATIWKRKGGSDEGLMSIAGWANPKMIARYAGTEKAERAAAEAQRLDVMGGF